MNDVLNGFDFSKFSCRVMRVTPELARIWLEKSKGKNFRNLDAKRARAIADDIISGNYDCNGETIKFNMLGIVVDGQTRLTAIVLANVAVDTVVVFGVKKIRNIDWGSTRTVPQLLKWEGYKYYDVLSPATRLLVLRDKSDDKDDVYCGQGGGKVTPSQIVDRIESDPEILPSVELVTPAVRKQFGLATQLSVFHYLAKKLDPVTADWFIGKLGDGIELEEGQPVLVLRKKLAELKRDKNSAKVAQDRYKMALAVLAWNHTMREESITQLHWRGSGPHARKFPAMIGPQGRIADDEDESEQFDRLFAKA